jgi:hypothetical protein
LRALAQRHGINPKTVAKWKKRDTAADRPTGPRAPHSTVLSVQEEAIIVAFRKHTLLPLDLPLGPPTHHPAPDALIPASLPAAAWHQPLARGDGRQAR